MTLPYAFNIDGRASAIPLALWCAHADRPDPAQGFKLQFAPIQGAFVACVRVSEKQASVPISAKSIRYGRTNAVGWVVKRRLSELGAADEIPEAPHKPGPAPVLWFLTGEDPVVLEPAEQSADPDLMYGLPNEGYRIFWTHDRALFDAFVEELARAPHETLDTWGVRLHIMEPFGEPASAKQLDLLDQEEKAKVSRLLLSGSRLGYHAGWRFEDKLTAAVFDATPTSLRALYRAEFLAWYARAAVERSGPHMSVLLRARGMIDAARQGSPEATFEASLWCDDPNNPMNTKRHFLWCDDPATAKRQHRVFAKYREYAWRCAMGDIRKNDFQDSLPTTQAVLFDPDSYWRTVADDIGRDTNERLGRSAAAVHPVFDRNVPKSDLLLAGPGLKAILAYYDLYALGRTLAKGSAGAPSFEATFDRHRPAWDQLPAVVEQACGELLDEARYDLLLRDVAACFRDAKDCAEHYERFFDAAAASDHRWWSDLATQSINPLFWKPLKRPLSVMKEALKSTGKSLSAMVEARLAAHTLAFKEAHELLDALYRHELVLTGQTIDPNVHFIELPDAKQPNFRAWVDVREGRVAVTREQPDCPKPLPSAPRRSILLTPYPPWWRYCGTTRRPPKMRCFQRGRWPRAWWG